MRKELAILSILVLAFSILNGCGNSNHTQIQEIEPLNSTNIKLLNERVSFDKPKSWKMLKKGIGVIEKEIYFIPFDNNSDPNNMGNAVIKCHYCKPELTVELYSEAMLKPSLNATKDNKIISDTNPKVGWREVKWLGNDGKKSFYIWDKFGVEHEAAVHFRVTCPVIKGKKAAINKIESETKYVLNSINITPKPIAETSETDQQNNVKSEEE